MRARRPAQGDDPRRRAEPDRAGHRVRLLLRARRLRAARARASRPIMVNCNPETVSTDYDTVRPALLRAADARGRAGRSSSVEQPDGRDRPVRRPDAAQAGARRSRRPACRSSGTVAGRDRPGRGPRALRASCSRELGLRQPASGIARPTTGEALAIAARIGYPVLVRPSLRARRPGHGDRATTRPTLARYMREAARGLGRASPVLIDRFLEDAIEVDVDASATASDVVVGGIMEHIEEAGIHSGDSAVRRCRRYSLGDAEHRRDRARPTAGWPCALGVRGLMNVQFAVHRATSSTCSRSTRAPRARCRSWPRRSACRWPSIAARVMAGETLDELRLSPTSRRCRRVFVKEAVFPFARFPGVDPVLGPEMKSTGEVMGVRRRLRPRLRQGLARRRRRAAARRHGVPVGATTATSRRWCRSRERLAELGFASGRHHRYRGRAGGRRAWRWSPILKAARRPAEHRADAIRSA